MAEQGGKTMEERVAKLEKGIVWLRVAFILLVIALAFVGVAVLQLNNTTDALAATEASRAAGGISASRFFVIERAENKNIVRAELGVKDGAACLVLYDAEGKAVAAFPASAATPAKAETKTESEGARQ